MRCRLIVRPRRPEQAATSETGCAGRLTSCRFFWLATPLAANIGLSGLPLNHPCIFALSLPTHKAVRALFARRADRRATGSERVASESAATRANRRTGQNGIKPDSNRSGRRIAVHCYHWLAGSPMTGQPDRRDNNEGKPVSPFGRHPALSKDGPASQTLSFAPSSALGRRGSLAGWLAGSRCNMAGNCY